jgi:RNA polymerase sigma-70 factor (ECF subfamily)
MEDSALERAFARFRRQGDAAALGEVFDGVAPELLRLARHLVGATGEAEDLVQATFVTAIERAASFDEERALVPWLVGILAKYAANARRARHARPAGAEAETADTRPGPAQAAEERELCEVLALELARLPETYRTIVARFLEGHAPREIAREQGLSDGATRVRVHRGLALLRRALPASVATGVAAVVSGGRGLADVRARVLVAAREAGPALVGAAATGSVAGGILAGVLAKKAVVSLAALLVLALAWQGRSGRTEEAVARVAQPELVAAPLEVSSELASPAGARPAAREVEPVRAELVRALGRVVEYQSGAPLAGARVWSTQPGASTRVERATVGPDGRVEFELPRAELETLFVAAEGFAPVAVPVTDQRRVRFWEEAGRNEDEPGAVARIELRV